MIDSPKKHDTDRGGTVLITKEELPHNVGYKISFVGVDGGLLRRNRYPSNSDKTFIPANNAIFSKYSPPITEDISTNPLFNDEDREKMRKIDNLGVAAGDHQLETNKTTNFVYVSEAGYKMFQTLGYKWFQSDVFEPEKLGGEIIGEGSESIAFKINIGGKDYVLKLVNKVGIQRAQGLANSFGYHLDEPEYNNKFGITTRISNITDLIQTYNPFETIEFGASALEYVAGRYFSIEEYKNGKSLSDWLTENQNTNAEQVANIKKELLDLRILFLYLSQVRPDGIRSIFIQSDFDEKNILIQDILPNGKLKICLIDQAPAAMADTRELINTQNNIIEKPPILVNNRELADILTNFDF